MAVVVDFVALQAAFEFEIAVEVADPSAVHCYSFVAALTLEALARLGECVAAKTRATLS